MDLQQESLKMHLENHGKMEIRCKAPLNDRHDLAVAYTPGVAEPCKEIKKAPDMAFEYTCRGNMAGICTDGTRVLGLGDIGAAAAMPVMEGKAVLFKRFGGVDAIPVCINEKDPDKFVAIVKALETSFAAINLEDISSPKCYDIEDKLKEIMDIPVERPEDRQDRYERLRCGRHGHRSSAGGNGRGKPHHGRPQRYPVRRLPLGQTFGPHSGDAVQDH